MKRFALAAAFALITTAAYAEPIKYEFDASHSQVVFSYNHLGFSTTYNMFSGFNGEIMFDKDNPAASSVSVVIPVKSLFTGWEKRFAHFMSADFFDASKAEYNITYKSTSIKVTGEDTADITGDLTINGVTKPVVLNAKLTKAGMHPRAKKEWVGFDATAKLKRSDFNMGMAAPFVSDEVDIKISIEAGKAG
ncbi:MAG: YceI family protein [Pseudomonadota bacterium]